MKATANNFLAKLVDYGLPVLCLCVCAATYWFYAQLVTMDDGQLARRALFFCGASDEIDLWNVTLAYQILLPLARRWADNLFHLRCVGMALVAVGSVIFSLAGLSTLASSGPRLLVGAALFLGGMGLYTFQPDNVPEFNHLTVVCLSCILALAIYWRRHQFKPSLLTKSLMGGLFGLFLAVNLSSGCAAFAVFSLFWIARHRTRKSLADVAFIGSAAVASYALFSVCFGGFTFKGSIPGLKYYRSELSELGKYLPVRGNSLYLALRSLAFSIEIAVVIPTIALVFWVGRKARHSRMRWLLCGLPLAWVLVSAWFSYRGFETYQLPNLWDFSPAFFFGKAIWYGYSTALPLLFLIAVLLGTSPVENIEREDILLCLLLLLVPLSACFGSSARVVHKMQLYAGPLVLIAVLLLEKTPRRKAENRVSYALLLILIGVQSVLAQSVPVARAGGVRTFSYSLDYLPRGGNLFAQKGIAVWLGDLHERASKLGMEKNAPVLSNDHLADYLLGFHETVLNLEGRKPLVDRSHRYGLLIRSEAQIPESKLSRSVFLKVIGPPQRQSEVAELEELLKKYLETHSFAAKETVDRGDMAQSVLYEMEDGANAEN